VPVPIVEPRRLPQIRIGAATLGKAPARPVVTDTPLDARTGAGVDTRACGARSCSGVGGLAAVFLGDFQAGPLGARSFPATFKPGSSARVLPQRSASRAARRALFRGGPPSEPLGRLSSRSARRPSGAADCPLGRSVGRAARQIVLPVGLSAEPLGRL